MADISNVDITTIGRTNAFAIQSPETTKVVIFGKELCTQAEWKDYLAAFREIAEELAELRDEVDSFCKKFNFKSLREAEEMLGGEF